MERAGQCPCGATTFAVHGGPIIRAICHCEICQAFNSAPYADIAVFLSKNVELPEGSPVAFRTYRPPPAVQRGKCTACDKPAIEFLRIPPLPGFTIIPSVNFREAAFLPEPSLHIFYHRRVADIDDGLPKYSGYWRSQSALASRLVMSLIRGSGANP